MKLIKKISIDLEVYKSIDDFDTLDKELILKAYEQSSFAYAPYSSYRVGCAILLSNKQILGGSNQENASYPAGICAERTALSACASLYPNVTPIKMAIVVNDIGDKSKYACAPCGICRQSICETQNRYNTPIEIIFPGENGDFYKAKSIESLLPLMFQSENLNQYL